MNTASRVLALFLTATLVACGSGIANDAPATSSGHTIGALRFIGEQRIPNRQVFQGTVVGGLSGIDFDAKSGNWILVSDDRSNINPARFYTARLAYDAQGFNDVTLSSVTMLKQRDGTVYPDRAQYLAAGGEVPDTEAIRFDPRDGSIWYTSEGDRALGLDPFVNHASINGDPIARLPLPSMLKVSATTHSGTRDNLGFEGLAFAQDGKSLWVAMEAPIYQDGAPVSPTHGGYARITQYDPDGSVLRQVAYPVDAIPAAPGPGMYADNGVTEMLAVDDHRFLMLERACVQGAGGNYKQYIRLYEMDISDATDIREVASLKGARFTAATKRLVLDLTTLDLPVLDNIEGIAWGPKLANGHDTLVLVSDNNFSPTQVTQFLAFEVESR